MKTTIEKIAKELNIRKDTLIKKINEFISNDEKILNIEFVLRSDEKQTSSYNIYTNKRKFKMRIKNVPVKNSKFNRAYVECNDFISSERR